MKKQKNSTSIYSKKFFEAAANTLLQRYQYRPLQTGDGVRYEITVWLSFEEKYGTKIPSVFSGMLRRGTKIMVEYYFSDRTVLFPEA